MVATCKAQFKGCNRSYFVGRYPALTKGCNMQWNFLGQVMERVDTSILCHLLLWQFLLNWISHYPCTLRSCLVLDGSSEWGGAGDVVKSKLRGFGGNSITPWSSPIFKFCTYMLVQNEGIRCGCLLRNGRGHRLCILPIVKLSNSARTREKSLRAVKISASYWRKNWYCNAIKLWKYKFGTGSIYIGSSNIEVWEGIRRLSRLYTRFIL